MHSASCEIIASFARNSPHPPFVFLHLNRVVFKSSNFSMTGLWSEEINRPHGHLFKSLASPVLQSWQIWCWDKHWYHSDFPALGPHSQMKHFNSSCNTWFASFDAIFEIQRILDFNEKLRWSGFGGIPESTIVMNRKIVSKVRKPLIRTNKTTKRQI